MGRLQSFINLNSLSIYPSDISARIGSLNHSTVSLIGEEWGHRFLAFPAFRDGVNLSYDLLGRDYGHWNYYLDSEASVMEGNAWKDNGDGTFTTLEDSQRYGRLDQYLMGLRSPENLGSFMLVTWPEPILKGDIDSLVSTFGMTSNAIRDSKQDFGSPDRLFAFEMTIGDSSSGFFSRWETDFVLHSGNTDTGPDPTVLSAPWSLASELQYATQKIYAVRKAVDSSPASRYFDPNTGKFTGELIVIKGIRREVTVTDIIEAAKTGTVSLSRWQGFERCAASPTELGDGGGPRISSSR
ncbi:MAG TPA: hypothetical protein VE398_18220 [Acidobacteriota bacterium]|nr:hypothetical protein [Acidobacteriota bacterium]